jgi:L-serine deaminase
MDGAIVRGCATSGLLPGPLRLPRRAGALMATSRPRPASDRRIRWLPWTG